MKESQFRLKLKKILESKGWLVFTLAPPVRTIVKDGETIWIPSKGQLFDLVAIKNQIGIPIEVKGQNTYYASKQKNSQIMAAEIANCMFAMIREAAGGKMVLTFPNQRFGSDLKLAAQLEEDLKEYLYPRPLKNAGVLESARKQ
jgi:hypothetical protein